jgi:acyl-CoA reductase-like NAD-dependent aldehyde dehydrogenase
VVGWRFVTHPLVGKVCFTGSTEVGQKIMAGCSQQVKRVTLELGGKSANVVFADADIEAAAIAAPYAVFDNAGQDCCARSRILVQASAYEQFMEYFESAVKAVKVIDPGDETSEMGPLISAEQREAVAAFVPEGAPVAFRGSAPTGPGYWFAPTVLAPLGEDSPAVREEIFGPVVAVLRFEDEADAIRIANDTPYGLSGSIWTSDVGRAFRVARAIETGTISVNSNSSVRYWTPFGGFKRSGIGRELGPDALEAFTELKNVFIATGVS